MANQQNLKPFTGADDPRRSHPQKGSKHISTWIQELLSDESFEANIIDSKKGLIDYKGAPLKAIIDVAIQKALSGDHKWAEWLAKHGYGENLKIEINDPRKEILEKYLGATNAGQAQDTESRSPADSA